MEKQISDSDSPGQVIIPFGKDEFASFIKSLLGKQQTNTKRLKGTFHLTIDHINDIIELINQRITQQNKSQLLQISLKIVFSDNSTRLLGSRQEIISFSEPRDVYPISAHLSLEYLIQFNDKDRPEKQDIELSFIINDLSSQVILSNDNEPFVFSKSQGIVFIAIKHTAVTWAYDIEALITKKIKSLMILESSFLKYLQKYSGQVSLAIAALLFVTIVCLNVIALLNLKRLFYQDFLSANLSSLDQKTDYLLKLIVNGSWNLESIFTVLLLFISLIVSIIIGVWIESAINFNQPSYLLFNDESNKKKMSDSKKIRKRLISFSFSILSTIAYGIVTKICIGLIFK